MPKRRRPARIPTPAWDRPRGRLGRLGRELGAKAYLLAGLLGLVLLAALVIVFAFVQDYREEQARPGSAAISVGDRTYSLRYFAGRLAQLVGQVATLNPSVAVAIVANQIIEEETVRRFASELGVTVTAEDIDGEIATRLGVAKEDPGFAAAYQQELARTGFSDQEYRQTVEAQLLARKVREKLAADIASEAEQIHYRQILVASEEEARQVIARLQGGEDFAALARELSLDTETKTGGGDRGWLAKGAAEPSLEARLFLLEPAAIGEPFPTDNGVLVFQVQEKAVWPLDDSQRLQVQEQSYRRWLQEKQQTLEITNHVARDPEKLQWALDRAFGS